MRYRVWTGAFFLGLNVAAIPAGAEEATILPTITVTATRDHVNNNATFFGQAYRPSGPNGGARDRAFQRTQADPGQESKDPCQDAPVSKFPVLISSGKKVLEETDFSPANEDGAPLLRRYAHDAGSQLRKIKQETQQRKV